jgi:hypothetical protein
MIILVDIKVLYLFSRKRKLSGFGHRVYKNYDPRAKVLKNLTEEVFSIVGRDPLIEVSIYFCSLMPIWFGIISLNFRISNFLIQLFDHSGCNCFGEGRTI